MCQRTEICCFCCDLKNGITILGCWEIIWLCLSVGSILSIHYADIGLERPYFFIPIYVQPFACYLPPVIVFLLGLCRSWDKTTRKMYKAIRTYVIAILLITTIAQCVYGWYVITNDYTLLDCNERKDRRMDWSKKAWEEYQDRRQKDINQYDDTNLPKYESYEDFVHMGLNAEECALQRVFSITMGCMIVLMFQIHFFQVAKSYFLDLVDPLPELPSDSEDLEMQGRRRRRGQGRNGEELDWDPNMYQNRQQAGQPIPNGGVPQGLDFYPAIPVGQPGQQNAEPVGLIPAVGYNNNAMGGVPVMGEPTAGFQTPSAKKSGKKKKIVYDINGLPLNT